MPTFGEAIKESTRLALCAVFAANESVNALLSPVFGDSLGLYPASSGLRRKLCSDDPANDPMYVPEFTGGQCPNVLYRVDYEFRNGSNPFVPAVLFERGPLSISNALGSGDADAQCQPGATFTRKTLVGFNGVTRVLSSGCNTDSRVVAVGPQGGGPNNCGDPPPPPGPPPGPVEFPTDITYNIDGDTTINVPVNLIFAPAYVNADFGIEIPVDITVDGLEFKGEATFSPEFNLTFEPKGVQPGPGVPDDDDDGGGGGGGTPVPENEDDFTPIIGVLVFSEVVSENKASVLESEDGPNIYAPRIGSVQFAIKTGNSIGWTADQDVKNLESYVPCPAPQGAIAVRVTPAPGISRTFTPVRGQPLTPPN